MHRFVGAGRRRPRRPEIGQHEAELDRVHAERAAPGRGSPRPRARRPRARPAARPRRRRAPARAAAARARARGCRAAHRGRGQTQHVAPQRPDQRPQGARSRPARAALAGRRVEEFGGSAAVSWPGAAAGRGAGSAPGRPQAEADHSQATPSSGRWGARSRPGRKEEGHVEAARLASHIRARLFARFPYPTDRTAPSSPGVLARSGALGYGMSRLRNPERLAGETPSAVASNAGKHRQEPSGLDRPDLPQSFTRLAASRAPARPPARGRALRRRSRPAT